MTEFAILPAVEGVLTVTFNRPIHISQVEELSEEERRNVLLRCSLTEGGGDIPATVIVKQVRAENYAPDDLDNWDTHRFYQGWAGLALLQQLSPEGQYRPRFYGGSVSEGFIVQEDNVLIDAVYGRMTFPTCWCANRLPADLIGRLESDYRQRLAQRHAAAQDDSLFDQSLVDACALWLFVTLDWQLRNAVGDNSEWGLATFRPRVLTRLGAFLEVAGDNGRYPAICTIATRLLDHLTAQWPEVEPLPLYPAFREQADLF